MSIDSSGHSYEEVGYGNGDALRVTLLPQGFYGERSLRIQMHDASGKVFPGPEVPLRSLPEAIAAIVRLAIL